MRAVDRKDKQGVEVLKHASTHYWVAKKHSQDGMRKSEGHDHMESPITMKKYENDTNHISKDLRLKMCMLKHHISYDQLFEEFMPKTQIFNPNLYTVPIELFEKVLAV